MLPISWFERLFQQEPFHDTPELVEILAALPATLQVLFESLRGEQAHGSTMTGFEILQIGVFGQALSGAGLPHRRDGLGIRNLDGEWQAVM